MISLGEMIAYLPIPGGHIKLAERFVNPAFSFTMGVSRLISPAMIQPLTAVTVELLVQLGHHSVSYRSLPSCTFFAKPHSSW